MVLPALAIGYLVAAPGRLRRRLWHLGAAGVVMLAVSLSWIALYTFTPGQRPALRGRVHRQQRGRHGLRLQRPGALRHQLRPVPSASAGGRRRRRSVGRQGTGPAGVPQAQPADRAARAVPSWPPAAASAPAGPSCWEAPTPRNRLAVPVGGARPYLRPDLEATSRAQRPDSGRVRVLGRLANHVRPDLQQNEPNPAHGLHGLAGAAARGPVRRGRS